MNKTEVLEATALCKAIWNNFNPDQKVIEAWSMILGNETLHDVKKAIATLAEDDMEFAPRPGQILKAIPTRKQKKKVTSTITRKTETQDGDFIRTCEEREETNAKGGVETVRRYYIRASDQIALDNIAVKESRGLVPVFTARPDGRFGYTFFRAEDTIQIGTVRVFGSTVKNYKLR